MAPETETRKDNGTGAKPPVQEAFPWERLPGESAEAFRAFTLYRTADPKTRSYDKVGDHSLMRRWANRFRWATRVAEWEAWLVLNQAELNEAGRLRFRTEQLSFARSSLAKAQRSVEKLDETKQDVESIVELATFAVRTGRVALDLPPDGPVRQGSNGDVGLTVSLPSVPWLAAFVPQTKPNELKQNETEIVVQSGEQVLDETPPIRGRKRLVQSVRDSLPDDLQAAPTVESSNVKSERAKPGTISSKKEDDPTFVAPPNREHPYRRCKKHGNACRRGGHN
jgi:hypothetical protein